MKTFLLFIATLFCFFISNAQESPQDMRDGSHIFNYPVELERCSLNGDKKDTAPENISENTTFKIRKVFDTFYVIEIVKFWGRNADDFNKRLVKDTEQIYFYLPLTIYKENAVRYKDRGSFTVGAATTLIKIRPGSKKLTTDGTRIYSEFGNDFNIGVSAGWKYEPNRKKEFSHSLVVGLSFSSIKVTPYTTENFIESESTQACITLSAGYVLEYKKFQVSIFGGYDLMSGEVGKNWIYRNRPWIGLGFGYQIFRAQGLDNQKAPNK